MKFIQQQNEEVNFEENFKYLNFNNQKKKPEGCFPKPSDPQFKKQPFPEANSFPHSEPKTESINEIPPIINNQPIHLDEDENDSEDEGIEDYKLGGYHPVHIGLDII